jgi:hypothetical protein
MVLDRRKFFKWLGVGTAATVVAPSAVKAMESLCVAPKPTAYRTYVMGKETLFSYPEYVDYANFSSFAISTSIDEVVEKAAAELGAAHSRRIAALVSHAGD